MMNKVSPFIKDLFDNISVSFVGTIADMYSAGDKMEDNDKSIRLLMKENRYMYIILMILFLMIVGNVFYS